MFLKSFQYDVRSSFAAITGHYAGDSTACTHGKRETGTGGRQTRRAPPVNEVLGRLRAAVIATMKIMAGILAGDGIGSPAGSLIDLKPCVTNPSRVRLSHSGRAPVFSSIFRVRPVKLPAEQSRTLPG